MRGPLETTSYGSFLRPGEVCKLWLVPLEGAATGPQKMFYDVRGIREALPL